jgi:CHAD domain-containing protein
MIHKIETRADVAGHAVETLLGVILAEGRKPVEALDMPDALAVHDLRKTFKRWRALLRLIAPTVGAEADALRLEARDLGREIASARDSRAMLEALADLGTDALSTRIRASITERLGRIGADAEAASLTPALKGRVGEALARAAGAVERWPLERLDRAETTRQLAAAYRRAAAAIPKDWPDASPEALHRLRQRVVEHRYQMEVVETVWPRLVRLWITEAQRLRDRLGAHQDLVLLGRLTEPHQPLAPWRSRLTPAIAARRAEHAEAARRLTGRLFAERPKAFRRRLDALWKHRLAGSRSG